MRLIDADALTKSVVGLAMDEAIVRGTEKVDVRKYQSFLSQIAKQKTIEAVPVIHCLDCKNYAGSGMYCGWNMIAKPDGHCHHANEDPEYSDD